MKRRALISATAVMLVALMCLVTASYAWFTSAGEGKIETFDVEVKGADAALQLSLDQKTWVSSLDKEDFVNDGQNVANTLKALSTPDAVNFFAADYKADTSSWTGAAVTNNKDYIAIDFYAYAPTAGQADFSINFSDNSENVSDFQFEAFKNAVKIGYKVGEGDFTIYDITEGNAYQPMNESGAIAKKIDGLFVPADGTEDKFAEAREQNAWETQTITFEGGEDKAQHISVVIWLEGMDEQCTGNFDMDAISIDIGFSNFR